MKDAYYFPHDSNAIHDPKCQALINDFGMTGYGLYWMLIEVMHEQGGKIEKFPKLFEGLAHEFRCEKEALSKQIEAMLKDYKLLKEDENFIWSDRVIRNIEQRRIKHEIKSEAGRIGGVRSGEVRKLKQIEAMVEANEQKESKVKESKVKEILIKDKYLSFVLLTKEEHQKLVARFGDEKTSQLIYRLNNYIGSKGKKYKSHYHTILNWDLRDTEGGGNGKFSSIDV